MKLNRKQKSKYLLVVIALLAATGILVVNYSNFLFKADTGPLPPFNTNLLINPDFENGSAGWWPNNPLPQKWQIATDSVHSGSASIQEQNDDSTYYKYPSQNVSVSPNDLYTFSAWVKSDNVQTSNTIGASICLEWGGADGKYIGGNYPVGIKGTNDWTQVSATIRVPSNATKVWFIIYMGKGSTGTAWWDDTNVMIQDGLTMTPKMIYPNYRNTILPGKSKKIKLGINIYETLHYPLSDLALNVSVKDSGGTIISQNENDPLTSDSGQVAEFDLSSSPPGQYSVVYTLSDKATQAELKTQTLSFTIDSDTASLPKVYVDQYNRTVKDGKLFFPLGFYSNGNSTSTMDQIISTGFNTMMSYWLPRNTFANAKATLDYAAQHNLNIIFSVDSTYDNVGYPQSSWTDEQGVVHNGTMEVFKAIVNSFKDITKYPALLSWYINDELDDAFIDQLQGHYDWLIQNDLNHPAWQVLYLGEDLASHVNNTDIMGVDNYPVWYSSKFTDNSPIDYQQFSRATIAAMNASNNSRSLWMVPEAKVDDATRMDTYNEMINYAYQGLVNGARGILYYNLSFLTDSIDPTVVSSNLDTMRNVSNSLNTIAPIALGLDVPADQSITSSDPKVSLVTRKVDEDGDGTYESMYALAVNSYDETVNPTLTIGSGLKVKDITVGLPGSPERTISVDGDSLQDQYAFGSLETRVYKINLAAPLPPTIISAPPVTYKDKITLTGTKDDTATEVLVNGSSDGVTLTNNTWSKEVTLPIGEKTTFTVTNKDSNGTESEPVTLDVTRHKLGDATGDGTIDYLDLSKLATSWGKDTSTTAGTNYLADFNEDGSVNYLDFSTLATNWKK